MEQTLTPSSYLFAILIFFVVQASREINWLSEAEASDSNSWQGEPFLLLLWPLAIVVGMWIVAPLTLGQRPHPWASVHPFLLCSYKTS